MAWLFFVAMMVFIIFWAGIMAGWGNFWVMFDFPSLMMVALIGISTLAASGLWKDFLNAFRLAVGKKKNAGLSEWKRAKEAVELFMKAVKYGGFFIALMEFANLYNTPDDPWIWRANLVVMSLVVLYAFGINVLLLPIRSRLSVNVIEYMQNGEEYEENRGYEGDTEYEGNREYKGDREYEGNREYKGDRKYEENKDNVDMESIKKDKG